MINSKKEYYLYRRADQIANNKKSIHARLFADYTYKYLITLRKCEYYNNCRRDLLGRFIFKLYKYRLSQYSLKTGIQIGLNTFGKGLMLFYYSSIIVNGSARFGEYCVIQSDTNVSANVKGGDMIYLAPGSKVLENVKIADNVIIGSNAVVTKNIMENSTSWAGVPAKKISDKGFIFQIKK